MALALVGFTGVAFAFTLGVHWGKQVVPVPVLTEDSPQSLVGTVDQQLPTHQEFVESQQGLSQVADETLRDALHSEVAKTGITLDTPRQVDLPKKTLSKEAGKTTLSHDAGTRPKALPKGPGFTLQIAEYSGEKEAESRLLELRKSGERVAIRKITEAGKPLKYRVYLGSYERKEEAQIAGIRFRARRVIPQFTVVEKLD